MKIESPAFASGARIPERYSRFGDNISPPLVFTDTPPQAGSLALIVDDPDAPDPKAPRMTWVHWVLYDLPPSASKLPEAAGGLPPGTKVGLNDWEKAQYGGPCPPIGRHRYIHKLYALDIQLPQAEALRPAPLPFEIIDQRPVKIAFDWPVEIDRAPDLVEVLD